MYTPTVCMPMRSRPLGILSGGTGATVLIAGTGITDGDGTMDGAILITHGDILTTHGGIIRAIGVAGMTATGAIIIIMITVGTEAITTEAAAFTMRTAARVTATAGLHTIPIVAVMCALPDIKPHLAGMEPFQEEW